jgi:very-short-patch-repair endonuclease
MKRPNGDHALERVRDLRRFSTEAEKALWSALRNRRVQGAKFRRQVWLNGFIADFFCAEARLVIEADGGQHAEQSGYDDRRTETLQHEGFRVIRFWNNDIMENLEGVVAAVADAFTLPPSAGWRAPPSPLKGEGN